MKKLLSYIKRGKVCVALELAEIIQEVIRQEGKDWILNSVKENTEKYRLAEVCFYNNFIEADR